MLVFASRLKIGRGELSPAPTIAAM